MQTKSFGNTNIFLIVFSAVCILAIVIGGWLFVDRHNKHMDRIRKTIKTASSERKMWAKNAREEIAAQAREKQFRNLIDQYFNLLSSNGLQESAFYRTKDEAPDSEGYILRLTDKFKGSYELKTYDKNPLQTRITKFGEPRFIEPEKLSTALGLKIILSQYDNGQL